MFLLQISQGFPCFDNAELRKNPTFGFKKQQGGISKELILAVF